MSSDLDDFIRQNRPGAKRSKLFPYLPAIRRLRGEGFSLEQVCKYLAANDVTMSVSGLASFIKRQEALVSSAQAATRTEGPSGNQAVSPRNDETLGDTGNPDQEALTHLNAKLRRERLADRFINPETTNPLLRQIMEKKQ